MSVKKGLFISRRFFAYAIVSGAMVLGTLFAFMPVKAATGINKQINFQGRLLNQQGATVADGYYNVQFKIYQDGTGTTAGNPGGTLKWTETFLNNNSQGVQVKNGFMSVQLGSVNPFGTSIDWNQDTLWLSINIGDTNLTCTPFSSCTPDGEMIPMKRLSSVPYALNSGQLGGLTGDQFVQIGQGVQGDATNNSSIFINKTGTGNLLELQDSGASALTVNNTGDITFGAAGNHTLSVDTAAAGVAGKSLTVTGGNAGTGAVVNGGDLLLQGGTASGTGITGSVIVRSNAADSTNAFQVQKANNSPVFKVDTTNSGSVQVAGTLDTIGASTLTIGGNATAISLSENTSVSGANTFTVGTGLTSLGGGLSVTAGAVDITSSIALKKGTDYSTTGTTNNVNFGEASLIRLTGASTQIITGIANGRDGEVLTIMNAAGQQASIANNDGGSSAANRIITGTGVDVALPAGASLTMVYDGGASLWRITSGVASTGGSGVNTVGTINSQTKSSDGAVIVGTNIYFQTADATSVGMVSTGTQTLAGAKTFNSLLTGSAGATFSGGALTMTGNAASSLTTSSGALTLTSAAAATWSTAAGDLTLQAGSGNVSLGSSTGLSSTGALTVTGGTTLSLTSTGANATSIDTGGAAGINIGTVNANAVSISRSGQTTTVNGTLAVTQTSDFTQSAAFKRGTDFSTTGTTNDAAFANASLIRLTGASAQTITGVANGRDGYLLTIVNAAGQAATIANNSGSSTAANRIITGTGADLIMPAGSSVTLVYDAGSSFWRVSGAAAKSDGYYIQNQNSAQQPSSNFWISGSGRLDTSVLTPLVDTPTAGTLSLGTSTATAITIGKSGITTTNAGAMTVSQLFTGNAGATINGGAISLTGNAASSFTTSSGALTLTSAAAATWSTAAGDLTLQAGSGTVSLGTSTALTSGSALTVTGGSTIDIRSTGANAASIDTGGAAAVNIGTVNANAVSISRTGQTATINGSLAVTETTDFTQSVAVKRGTDFSTTGTSNNVSFANASLVRLTGASAQTITGIANGRDGYLLTLVNAAGQAATIANNSGSSTAANRITTGTGADVTLPAGASITVIYDAGASLWRVTSGAVAATGGYIQNQNAAQQPSSNFWLSGTGRADVSFLTPSVDVATAGTLSVGTSTATAITIGKSGITTTNAGAMTVTQLFTGNAGATINGGAISLTGNAASSFTTSSGALTLTSAAAATWSTAAGDLTLQAGSGTVSLGSSTTLTSTGALTVTGGSTIAIRSTGANTATVDAGGAAAVNIGTVNANAVSISRTGQATTINGSLAVTEASDFTQSIAIKKGTDFSTTGTSNNVSFANASLVRLTGASAQTITGIANGRDGYLLTIVNAAGQAATIANANAGSTAANRIVTGTAGDITLPAGASVTLVYDSTTAVWRVSSGAVASVGGYIQNQNSAQQASANFWISGSGRADTSFLTPLLDTPTAVALNIGTTNATAINLNQNTTIAATKSLTVTSGTTSLTGPTAGSSTVLAITTNTIDNVGMTITSTSGQTADLFRIVDGVGTPQVTINAVGTLNGNYKATSTGATGSLQLGSTASQSSGDINGTIGFWGAGIKHAQIAYSVGDGFYLCDSSAGSPGGDFGQCTTRVNLYGQDANFNGTALFKTTSATAFQVQDGSASLFTVDTSARSGSGGNLVKIGNSTGTDTATTLLQLDGATAAPTTNLSALNGGMYYNSTSNHINVVENATVREVCTNSGNCDGTTGTGYILNQTGSNQTANFQISGTGRANTSILTPILDVASAGLLTIGGTTATTIQIGNTSLSSGTQAINIGTNNTSGGTTNVTIGAGASATGGTTALQAKNNITLTTNGVVRGTFDTSNNLYLGNGVTAAAPNNFAISGTGSTTTAVAGGALTIQGGNATVGNANGGNVTLAGGTGIGTGVKGLVVIDTPVFTTSSTQNCAANCTITQANVDSSAAVLINATATGVTATLNDPTIQTAGKIMYVTNVGTNDFTLSVNGGGTGNTIAMKPNTTATMIWSGVGGDWTAAGASSSTDLQSAYNNTLTSAGGAELVLNASGGAADGLTIRNNATTPIIGGILEAQTSVGSNLFSVNNNATEYANNGGAESSTFTMWTGAPAGGTISRYTTAGNNIATGAASVFVDTTTTAATGVRNTLSSTLTANLKYRVSYAIRHTSSTTSFTTLDTVFSRDGTNTSTVDCSTGQTATYGQWTRISCTFTAPSSGITASNAIFIRHSDAVEHDFYIDNLSVNVSADVNHAADGSVDSALGTNWTAYDADGGAGTTTLTRDTTTIYDTSGSVKDDTTNAANEGMRNNMTITPQVSTQYLVSFYARSSNTFNNITVGFLPAGGSATPNAAQLCTDYNTQSVSTSGWTKITCLFTTPASGITDPDLVIYQPTAPGSTRTFYVDALSITLNTNNSSNVQIGGGNKGGPATLFTLDRSAGAPIANNNDAYLGSMFYDTTTGRIQCYEADGWGACGAAPDNIVNLNPEYAGAVLNGSGIGTMTADFCSNDTALTVNSTLCSTGQAKNFYRWTSPQGTQQTYSIYVTYQLPATFNGFSSDDTVQLTARVDNTTNASVTYEMYKSTGSAVTQCGTGETNVITGGGGSANTWYSYGINGNESTGCSFSSSSAGNLVIFKINLKANSNANAYVSTLTFTTTGR